MVENLLADNAHHFERLHRGDRVYENVAVNTNEVLGIQNAVLILLNCPLGRSTKSFGGAYCVGELTCPAVSMISVAYSWFLYLMTLLNVFSMVG